MPQTPVPPPPPPAAAYMHAVPQQAAWQPNTQVAWTADSNIGGREGFATEWEVVLHYDCTPGDACKAATLITMNGPAERTVAFPAPPIGGTLRVRVRGWTYAGLQQEGVDMQAAQGTPLCACTGPRTVVSPDSIGWRLNNNNGGSGNKGVAITLSAFPAAGTLGGIVGRVTGLAEGSTATLRMWLRTKPLNDEWWVKPNVGAASILPLAVDGAFTIANWASDPAQDVAWADIRLAVIPPGLTVPDVLGWPVPANVINAALAVQTFPRGYTPAGGQPPPPPPPPPPAGQGAITITAFPAPGSTSGIAGSVTGLAAGAGYKAVLYLEGAPPNPPGSFWIKPYPGSSVPLVQAPGPSWTFAFAGWASAPQTDQVRLTVTLRVAHHCNGSRAVVAWHYFSSSGFCWPRCGPRTTLRLSTPRSSLHMRFFTSVCASSPACLPNFLPARHAELSLPAHLHPASGCCRGRCTGCPDTRICGCRSSGSRLIPKRLRPHGCWAVCPSSYHARHSQADNH